MAKAVAKTQGKAAQPARSKAAQAKAARGKTRRAGPRPWVKVLVLILLFPFAALLLPTTLVFSIMMAPTIVGYITDRSRDKHLAITVGLMNFAGTLPAIIDLWSHGQSHQAAMDLIGDVFVWSAAYGAAGVGCVIFAAMPAMVASYYRVTTKTRTAALVKRQKALIHEWGHAVAEGLLVTMPPEVEDDDETEDGPDVTEAELVEPVPGR